MAKNYCYYYSTASTASLSFVLSLCIHCIPVHPPPQNHSRSKSFGFRHLKSLFWLGLVFNGSKYLTRGMTIEALPSNALICALSEE